MSSRRGFLLLMSATVLFGGCAPKTETAEQAEARMTSEASAARTAIEALNAQFAAHFKAEHGDSVAAFYTEDGRVMAPGTPAAVGRAAIAQAMGMVGASPDLALTIESVVANGPLAVERGTYRITLTVPGVPERVTETGKFLVHWRKVGDNWMKVDDIWNSDTPSSPSPPTKP